MTVAIVTPLTTEAGAQ